MLTKILLLSALDISIHYQLYKDHQVPQVSQDPQLKEQHTTNLSQPEGPQAEDFNSSSFSVTAHQFLIAAVLRTLLILVSCQLCVTKAIPKVLQPHMGYVIGAFVYVFYIHAVARLLVDSERPNVIQTPSYVFICVFNVIANISALLIVRNIVFHSVETDKNTDDVNTEEKDKQNEKEDEPKEKDLEEGERTQSTLTMLWKLAGWYRSQAKWIAAGYFCLFARMPCKLHFKYIREWSLFMRGEPIQIREGKNFEFKEIGRGGGLQCKP